MNKKTSLTLFAGVLGLASMAAAHADNTVLTTYGAAKGGRSVMNLDIQSNGDATALQFLVTLPKGVTAAGTQSCLSSLPKSHVGLCRSNKDGSKVAVVVYSLDNSALPSGMIEVGQLNLNGMSAEKGAVSVSNVLFAGPKQANVAKGSSEVVDLDRDGRNRAVQSK